MCFYKFVQTLNYMIQVSLAYFLMLCVMSFNMGVFIATIAGLTVGNFIVNPKKLQIDRLIALQKEEERIYSIKAGI